MKKIEPLKLGFTIGVDNELSKLASIEFAINDLIANQEELAKKMDRHEREYHSDPLAKEKSYTISEIKKRWEDFSGDTEWIDTNFVRNSLDLFLTYLERDDESSPVDR